MSEPRPIPPIENDAAERLALEAAVAEARADPGPDVPHEEARQEMLDEIAEFRRRIYALHSGRRRGSHPAHLHGTQDR